MLQEPTPIEDLAFFDAELATLPFAVHLVRILLTDSVTAAPLRISEAQWPLVFDRLAFHRVLPQLDCAAKRGYVELTGPMRRDLDVALVGLAFRALKLEQMLVVVGEALAESGIDFRVLKGMATARLDLSSPELRTSVDVDLLLRPADLMKTAQCLQRCGFVRPYVARDLFDKGQTWADEVGGHVDLHTRLHAPARPLADRWLQLDERSTFWVGGRQFSALSRGARRAHAASHLALSWPSSRRMSSLLDLFALSIAATSEERVISDQIVDQMRIGDICQRVTSRAARVLDRAEVVTGVRRRRPMDFALRRAYDRPDDAIQMMKATTILGMPWSERVEVLGNIVAPSAKYLAEGGYSSRCDRFKKVWKRSIGNRSAP